MGKKKGKKGGKSKKKTKKSGSSKDASKSIVPTAQEKLWEKRFQISEHSRTMHRANSKSLVTANIQMQNELEETEDLSVATITKLRDELETKDALIRNAETECKDTRRAWREDVTRLEKKFESQIATLQQASETKDNEITELRGTLAQIQEFSQLRTQMESQIVNLKKENRRLQETFEAEIEKREKRFDQEKIRIRRKSDMVIGEIADNAHKAALAELQGRTEAMYTTNAKLETELRIVKEKNHDLTNQCSQLKSEVHRLRQAEEESRLSLIDLTEKSLKDTQELSSLRKKVARLEGALGDTMRSTTAQSSSSQMMLTNGSTSDVRIQRKGSRSKALVPLGNSIDMAGITATTTTSTTATTIPASPNQSITTAGGESSASFSEDIKTLQRALELKSAEAKKIRKVAKSILAQRSDVETFLIESLGHVKQEIKKTRASFEKEMQGAYRKQVSASLKSKGSDKVPLPPIQTFTNSSTSTNPASNVFEGADELPQDWTSMEIGDMSWEQRERVLNLLLHQINTTTSSTTTTMSPSSSPSRQQSQHRQLIALPVSGGDITEMKTRDVPLTPNAHNNMSMHRPSSTFITE